MYATRFRVGLVLPISLLLAASIAAPSGCGSRPPAGLDAGLSGRGTQCDPATEDCACEAPGTTGVCQHTNTPDPGPMNWNDAEVCTNADQGYEFLGIWDFEGADVPSMYSYTDRSAAIRNFFDPQTGTRKTWQPPTTVLGRCGNPSNRALHILGGPYLSWGGGVGLALRFFPPGGQRACFGLDSDPDYCPSFEREPDLFDRLIDLSKYEGVSFWARRGPDSQGGIRILLGDKYTDDDISFLMYQADPTRPRYCERVRECACQNHMPCTVTPASTVEAEMPICFQARFLNAGAPAPTFCGKPEPLVSGEVGMDSTIIECNTCDRTRCEQEFPAFPDQLDNQFNGRPCTPYTHRNGISTSFCFDPNRARPDKPDEMERPAEPEEQCGDHWTAAVALSTEWQQYFVRFDSMVQQGFAKRFPSVDLHAASVLRFTWEGGWVDYWIDDVRFFRRRR